MVTKKNTNYIKEVDLYYELVLSKGKGKLTRKAERQFVLIADNVIHKLKFRSYDDQMDCYQQSVLHLFKNWYGFNPLKYKQALPYVTEILKRGLADGANLINNKKYHQKLQGIKVISIDWYYNF